jgi:membrane protease YdiL (CAAX protease family)
MVALSLLLLKRSGISWEQAGLRTPRTWKGLILGLVGIVFLAFTVTFCLLVSRAIYDPSYVEFPLGRRLFWIVAYVPVGEEIFLRGWFQSSLTKLFEGTRDKFVVLLSAIVFGMMHLGWFLRGRPGNTTMIGVIAGCFLGWICARARQRSESIVPAVVLHSVYNLTSILIGLGIDWTVRHPVP